MARITTSIAVAIASAISGDPATELRDDILCPHLVVRAKVIKITRRNGRYDATFEVTHVFKGDGIQTGEAFSISANVSGETVLGLPGFRPILKPGDNVIWLLERKGNKLQFVRGGLRYDTGPHFGIVPVAVREGDKHPDYKHVLSWAEALERTVKANTDGRRPLLKGFAKSKIREVAAWACAVLAQSDRTDAIAFFEELLSDKSLQVRQKVLVDEILSRIKQSKRAKSKERLVLFQQWVTSPLSDADAYAVFSGLDLIVQHRDFSNSAIFQVLTAILDNKKLSLRAKKQAVWIVGRFANRKDDSRTGFRFVFQLVRERDNVEIQRHCADMLRKFFLKEVRTTRSEVIALSKSASDKRVREILRKTLKAANR